MESQVKHLKANFFPTRTLYHLADVNRRRASGPLRTSVLAPCGRVVLIAIDSAAQTRGRIRVNRDIRTRASAASQGPYVVALRMWWPGRGAAGGGSAHDQAVLLWARRRAHQSARREKRIRDADPASYHKQSSIGPTTILPRRIPRWTRLCLVGQTTR